MEPMFVHTARVKDNPYERPLLVVDTGLIGAAWHLLVRVGNPEHAEDALYDVPAHQAQPCMVGACHMPGCHILRNLDAQAVAQNEQRIRQGAPPLARR